MRPILPVFIALSMVAASAQAASLAGAPRPAAPAAALQISLGQAARIALSRPADSIVLGSDDVISAMPVGNARTIAITGKKAGVTNILVLDLAGAVILDRQVLVAGSGAGAMSVISGGGAVTNYSCSPACAMVDSNAGYGGGAASGAMTGSAGTAIANAPSSITASAAAP